MENCLQCVQFLGIPAVERDVLPSEDEIVCVQCKKFFTLTHCLKRKKFYSHMYKESQKGSGAKSYMRKSFLIYEEISHI